MFTLYIYILLGFPESFACVVFYLVISFQNNSTENCFEPIELLIQPETNISNISLILKYYYNLLKYPQVWVIYVRTISAWWNFNALYIDGLHWWKVNIRAHRVASAVPILFSCWGYSKIEPSFPTMRLKGLFVFGITVQEYNWPSVIFLCLKGHRLISVAIKFH